MTDCAQETDPFAPGPDGGPRFPDRLYRFFGSEQYADEFVAGRLKISTLGECRNHESLVRRDTREGQVSWALPDLISSNREEIERMPDFLGLKGAKSVYAVGNSLHEYVPDAYVLCFTRQYDKSLHAKFGDYCVEIPDPARFATTVCHDLAQHLQLIRWNVGPVQYDGTERHWKDRETIAGRPAGFTKDPRFQEEAEFRVLFHPPAATPPIRPHFLTVPALAGRTRRIA